MSSEHSGVIIPGHPDLRAMVYTTEPQPGGEQFYYFCCHVCGNCGTHWLGDDYAIVQAVQHLTEHLKGVNDGEGQRTQ